MTTYCFRLLTFTSGLMVGLALPAQAPKVIQGHLKDALGNPVTSVRVEAWDKDGAIGGGDDFMGQDLTIDSSGGYQITFTHVAWDGPRSKHHTSWRPDIYVKVLNSAGGEMMRSEVRSNWKLRNSPLTIDMQLPVQNHEIGFSVPVHGFHFTNDFPWFFVPFGLCGGMTRHAADLYVDNQPVPSDTNPPSNDTALWGTLLTKQIQSLDYGGGIKKVLEWMLMLDEDFILNGPFGTSWVVWRGIGHRTKRELPRLKELLQADIPVPLLLIRDTVLPWHNHQVLAIGFRLTQPEGIEVHVYDPNRPHEDGVWLQADLSDHARNDINPRQFSTSNPAAFPGLRGFYIMPGPDHPANLQGNQPYAVNPVVPSDIDNPVDGAFLDKGAAWFGDFDGNGFADAFHYDAARNKASLHASDGARFTLTREDASLLPNLADSVLTWSGRFLEPNKDSVLTYTPGDNGWRLWFIDPFTGLQRVDTIGVSYLLGDLVQGGYQFLRGDFVGNGLEELLVQEPVTGEWKMFSAATGTLTYQVVGWTQGLDARTMATNYFVGRFQAGATHSQVLVAPASTAMPWTLLAIDPQNQLVTTPIAANTGQFGDLTRDEVLFHEGDFDGDGATDLLFYDRASGQWQLGRLVGTTLQWSLAATTAALGPLHNENAITTAGDFDGDGDADVMVFQFPVQGFFPATWSLGTFANQALTFTQVFTEADFDPEDQVFIVGRYVDTNRDSLGFYDPARGSYRFWTVTPAGFLEKKLYDVTQIGAGCPNPAFEVPEHAVMQQPLAGSPVTLVLESSAPNSLAVCFVGFSTTTWNGSPLPLSLAQFGGPAHCSVWVSGDLIWTVATNATGHAEITLPLSNGTLGLGLRSQFGVFDFSINGPIPVLTSNAMLMRVR